MLYKEILYRANGAYMCSGLTAEQSHRGENLFNYLMDALGI